MILILYLLLHHYFKNIGQNIILKANCIIIKNNIII